MTRMGVGATLRALFGSNDKETAQTILDALGETILALELDPEADVMTQPYGGNKLHITFSNYGRVAFWDHDQECCERRWMSTDDRLADFVGAAFLGAELRAGRTHHDPANGTDEEIQFLDIRTNRGVIQFANHNEHNGYYGGFYLVARRETENEP